MPPGSVIDAGASNGQDACWISSSDRNRTVHALDPSRANIAHITAALESGATPMDTNDDTPDALAAQRLQAQSAIDELRAEVISEEHKFAAWHQENIRRKHNYIPLVVGMLKALAEKGKLGGLIDKAEAKKQEILAK